MLIAVRRLCGQLETGPRGVALQSLARMSAPISPPPARQSSGRVTEGKFIDALGERLAAGSLPVKPPG